MQDVERLKTRSSTTEIAQTPFTDQDQRDIERAESEGMIAREFIIETQTIVVRKKTRKSGQPRQFSPKQK